MLNTQTYELYPTDSVVYTHHIMKRMQLNSSFQLACLLIMREESYYSEEADRKGEMTIGSTQPGRRLKLLSNITIIADIFVTP